MNEETKYPFNVISVHWYQQWRKFVMAAKSAKDPETQIAYCRMSALAQCQYLVSLIQEYGDIKHD